MAGKDRWLKNPQCKGVRDLLREFEEVIPDGATVGEVEVAAMLFAADNAANLSRCCTYQRFIELAQWAWTLMEEGSTPAASA